MLKPPSGKIPYCDDAESEERFRKFLEIMAEIDLQRFSDLIQRQRGKKCQPDPVAGYNNDHCGQGNGGVR